MPSAPSLLGTYHHNTIKKKNENKNDQHSHETINHTAQYQITFSVIANFVTKNSNSSEILIKKIY